MKTTFKEHLGAVTILVAALFLLALLPLALVWSLNTLNVADAGYNLATWVAALVTILILGATSTS